MKTKKSILRSKLVSNKLRCGRNVSDSRLFQFLRCDSEYVSATWENPYLASSIGGCGEVIWSGQLSRENLRWNKNLSTPVSCPVNTSSLSQPPPSPPKTLRNRQRLFWLSSHRQFTDPIAVGIDRFKMCTLNRFADRCAAMLWFWKVFKELRRNFLSPVKSIHLFW